MKSEVIVAQAPAKPVVVYDGDCRFCETWIRRWREHTGERVEYVPFQTASVRERFPEVNAADYEQAVHFIDSDGAVYRGAEAAYRAWAVGPAGRWFLEWYEHSAGFAKFSEKGYAFIARNRKFFSWLTRLGWGEHAERPGHERVQKVFIRGLAVIYAIAFISLWAQIQGLIGAKGILPAAQFVAEARQSLGQGSWSRFHSMPTLCWWNAGEGSLNVQCAAGVLLSLALFARVAPALSLFLLWLIYLSLSTVCQDFLGFQWDVLLLETGFLAIFFVSPREWLPKRNRRGEPSKGALWLLRLLLFKLMFESGCVKLLSGDPTWRHWTALQFHFETQPLPTWIGWWAHQLPEWMQKGATGFMFGIELIVPFLIFGPRRVRFFAFWLFVGLQVVILLTGNYCFFNWLTILLCIPLLDDFRLKEMLPRRWRASKNHGSPAPPVDGLAGKASAAWPKLITIAVVIVFCGISLMQAVGMFGIRLPWPRPFLAAYQWAAPFRTINHYGLFAVMTTERLEIIVEGSEDGRDWRPYQFKYKPGDLNQRPRFVAPHQPRLDWQMWFAALSDYRQNPWLINFCVRLLEGSPKVLRLLKANPFPNGPPKYVRAMAYQYHFTDFKTWRQSGNWWRRELKGIYLPPISLKGTLGSDSVEGPPAERGL